MHGVNYTKYIQSTRAYLTIATPFWDWKNKRAISWHHCTVCSISQMESDQTEIDRNFSLYCLQIQSQGQLFIFCYSNRISTFLLVLSTPHPPHLMCILSLNKHSHILPENIRYKILQINISWCLHSQWYILL